MKVLPDKPCALLLTYLGDDKDRLFDILVEGKKIAAVDWQGGQANTFYDQEYAVPADLIAGKSSISVRIEANYGKTAGRIFGCRTVWK